MSGNKWLNIEVAQNTMEVEDTSMNLENNIQMKNTCKNPCKVNKSMQNSFQMKTSQNTRKNIRIRNPIKIANICTYINNIKTYIFQAFGDFRLCSPGKRKYTWNTSKKLHVMYAMIMLG